MNFLFLTLTVSFLLYSAAGFTAPTSTPAITAPYPGTSQTTPAKEGEEEAQVKEEDVQVTEPDVLTGESLEEDVSETETQPSQPPAIPPGTSFTPEQIKAFLSQPKEENYIILNFDNAALRDVINTISSITGENFILTPGLDARITIHSTGKIPAGEALSVFESLLEVNNMALVRSGRFYKIVPAASAKQKPIEIHKGSASEGISPVDRIITQIVQVEYVPVTEISKVIQPMLSQFGNIIPNPRNNLLIINEVSSNLKRLMSILEEIDKDVFEHTRMGFFQPKYSDVQTLSQDVQEILRGLNIAQHGIAVIPVERINSLVVFASTPSLLKTVETWLRKLDEEVTMGQNIFVYRVQNVKAESLVDVLRTIYETEGAAAVKPKAATAQKTAATKTPPRIPRTASSTAQSRVEIVLYEPTNALVILAPPGIYRDIKETIKKLDVYPQEVLIEAIIAQVTLSDADDFGVQWSVLHDIHIEDENFEGLLQGRSANAPAYTLPLTLGTGSSTASVIAGGLSYLLFKPERFAALIHAIASKGKVDILSSPRLLVRDQEEASIEVGSEIPTATSTTSTTTTDTLTQNIEYRTVGVKLNIKPTINDERTVVLDLEQEVSSKGDDQQVGQTGNLFPSFNTTKTKTSIIVPDRQGIIIGGLMEETKDKNYQGVPILSAIPVLGHLFRYTKNSTTKKELVILITPYVVSNREEADVITLDFLDRLRDVKDFLRENERRIGIPSSEELNTSQTYEQ
jgi:general secretion pathway protein D